MGNSHNEIRGFMGNLPIPSHNPLWEGIHGKFPKALMGISHEIWVNLLITRVVIFSGDLGKNRPLELIY